MAQNGGPNMGITITQGFSFGDNSTSSYSTTWVITCTATGGVFPTPHAVRTALLAAVPTYEPPAPNAVFAFNDVSIQHVTDALYLAEAKYVAITKTTEKIAESGGYVLDFDATGETQHINVSLGVRSYVANQSDSNAPESTYNVIGFDGKKVNGVDILHGVYRFSEEWQLPASTVTGVYRRALGAMVGKVNNALFRGWAKGEVRFDGAKGRRVKGEKFSITFSFSCSPNATDLIVGSITVAKKEGWEYLDVWMVPNSNEKKIVQEPSQANVHQVMEYASFASLGIGTGDI